MRLEIADGEASALFDPLGLYRYRLTRTWGGGGPTLVWCMLNPSTASATTADPTLRRVIGFTRAWGFGSVDIVNLFAWRASRPGDLLTSIDPVGPDNDDVIEEVIAQAERVVVAWGNRGATDNSKTERLRCDEVSSLLSRYAASLWCLGTTASRQPRHPLYVNGDRGPVECQAIPGQVTSLDPSSPNRVTTVPR